MWMLILGPFVMALIAPAVVLAGVLAMYLPGEERSWRETVLTFIRDKMIYASGISFVLGLLMIIAWTDRGMGPSYPYAGVTFYLLASGTMLLLLRRAIIKRDKNQYEKEQNSRIQQEEDSRLQFEAEKKQLQEERAPLREIVDQIVDLMERFCSLQDVTPQETRAVWKRYNALMAQLGVTKLKDEERVYCILRDVMMYIHKTELYDDLKEQNLIERLLQFYYKIAFYYHLEERDQGRLLQYLARCFRTSNDKQLGFCREDDKVEFRRAFREDFNWRAWDKWCVKLMEKGCKLGNSCAMWILGDYYFYQDAVDLVDYEKAFSLYVQAARMGNMYAVSRMAYCYEQGIGTRRDYQKAGDCYQYAYDHTGAEFPAERLNELYLSQKWDRKKYSPDIFTTTKRTMKKENLAELRGKVAELSSKDLEAEDLNVVAFSARKVLETVVNSFMECYESDRMRDALNEKIVLLTKRGHFTKEIARKAHSVRMLGNRGVHEEGKLSMEKVEEAIFDLKDILTYYAGY